MSTFLFFRKNHAENRLENTIFPRVLCALLGWGGVLGLIMLSSVAPASAQAVMTPQPAYLTPTPLPGVQATLSAGGVDQSVAAAKAEADRKVAQAAQDYAATIARAAEIKRNLDAQASQAMQAYSDARAAVAAQNAGAAGEAIGRGESIVKQQSESMAGMTQIVATLTTQHESDKETIAQLKRNMEVLTVDKQTILNSYTALKETSAKAVEAAGSSSTLGYIVELAGFLLLAILLLGFAVWVMQGRRGRVTVVAHDDHNDYNDHDDRGPDDTIDAEYTEQPTTDEGNL